MSTATELEAFEKTLDFVRGQAQNPVVLMGGMSDIVSAIEWGLFDGPELVDRSHLPLVSGGVKQLITDLGGIAKRSQTDETGPESEYALYKLCDWRAQSKDIIGSWLSGWWTHNDGGVTEKPSIVASLSDGLRVLQFGGWWSWHFYISPSANRLRRQCDSVKDAPPPPPVEDPLQPPLPLDEDMPQQQCASLDELAAFLGVKFGKPCSEEVMQAYQTRLEYAPMDIDTLWDLARCYTRQKDYLNAIKAYEDLLQDRPEFHDARKELIFCLAALQQWDAAETEARYLEGFINMRPEAELVLECLQSLRYQT